MRGSVADLAYDSPATLLKAEIVTVFAGVTELPGRALMQMRGMALEPQEHLAEA